ncbi:MAG: hypothetical protein JXB03_11135 [Spirochaetales bacterium]|nr:hypothetical protein [Spirochaetales bacterium]
MKELALKLLDPAFVPVLFGLTPPKEGTCGEKLLRMNTRRAERLKAPGLDGLCIYEVQDERARAGSGRIFAPGGYMDTAAYRRSLGGVTDYECISCCAVGPLSVGQLKSRIRAQGKEPVVLVGPVSRSVPVRTALKEAFSIAAELEAPPLTGAVCIPERSSGCGNEAERMLAKASWGAGFFITQCIYDPDQAQALLASYAQGCRREGTLPRKILFTLSPAGSRETLQFMGWLGIKVPQHTERRILCAHDPLAQSVQVLEENALVLAESCRCLGLSFGFNVESVVSRKNEFLAAAALAASLKKVFEKAALCPRVTMCSVV